MQYLFDAWCQDPRPLLFCEFLEEVNGFLALPETLLDELDRQWEEPTSPFEQELAALCRECRRRTGLGQRFAVCFIGIDHFKEHSDRYGAAGGGRVVSLLSRTVRSECPPDGFVARVGDSDFVLVLTVSRFSDGRSASNQWPSILGEVCDVFDRQILRYTQKYLAGTSRAKIKPDGKSHPLPTMTLSIGVVTNEHRRFQHFSQIAELAREMQNYAKAQPGSVFVVDRRYDPAER
jgi:GGDEF domain-containing protein